MISEHHNKHTTLIKPDLGNFGRNEWAIVGAPCPAIKLLADEIISSLSVDYKCAYVDAVHTKENETIARPGRLASGAIAEYTDRISHHQFDFHQTLHSFQLRQLLNEADLVLVNGNHQQAKAQVVVIDPEKENSLRKRMHQLTQVQLFLLADGVEGIFEFVKEALPAWKSIPVYQLSDKTGIISFFRDKMQTAQPVLNGLVLAGGKSLRLGSDKGMINWHGTEQRGYMAGLLQPFCKEVFISCREEQLQALNGKYKTITDSFVGLGPYGAILSAFRQQPNAAWLVVACDLPLLDAAALRFLVQRRRMAATATAFESPHDGLPEPLIAIWEPKSYSLLLSFLAQGYSCPRKVLINSDACILKAPSDNVLMNVNTPEDLQLAKEKLKFLSASDH